MAAGSPGGGSEEYPRSYLVDEKTAGSTEISSAWPVVPRWSSQRLYPAREGLVGVNLSETVV